jgi:hypothetical protein
MPAPIIIATTATPAIVVKSVGSNSGVDVGVEVGEVVGEKGFCKDFLTQKFLTTYL